MLRDKNKKNKPYSQTQGIWMWTLFASMIVLFVTSEFHLWPPSEDRILNYISMITALSLVFPPLVGDKLTTFAVCVRSVFAYAIVCIGVLEIIL